MFNILYYYTCYDVKYISVSNLDDSDKSIYPASCTSLYSLKLTHCLRSANCSMGLAMIRNKSPSKKIELNTYIYSCFSLQLYITWHKYDKEGPIYANVASTFN